MVSRRQLVRCQSRRYPAGLLDLATGERYFSSESLLTRIAGVAHS
jgi:hypothetical protein